MKSFYVFLLLALFLNTAYAYSEDDLEWAGSNSKELYLGDMITNGIFTVKVSDFPTADLKENKFVGIKLYENGIQVAEYALIENEDYIYHDSIRISVMELSIPKTDWASGLPEQSWAKIKLESRGIPGFNVKFETDKDDYPAYVSQIEMDLTIYNSGDAKADDVNIYIESDDLELIDSEKHYHYSDIEKGERIDHKTGTVEFDPVPLKFSVPSVIMDTEFNVIVRIEYTDITGMNYSYSKSYPVKVSGMFRFSKTINDNIYINEKAIVTISLTNIGSLPINGITVTDSLPRDFELDENSSLEWELDLNSGESKSFTYTLLPLQPDENGYTVPPANAQWTQDSKEYYVLSNSPCITVYGPKIELSKSVDPDTIDGTGTVSVTIKVKNTGNVLANIEVSDYLWQDAELIDGELEAEMVLRGGEDQTFGYSMKLDISDSIELPCASAHFVDTQDYKGDVVSDVVLINMAEEEKPLTEQTNVSVNESLNKKTSKNNSSEDYENADIGWICIFTGFACAVLMIRFMKSL